MENTILVSFRDIEDKIVKAKHLDSEDLFDDDDDSSIKEDLKFDVEHYSKDDNSFKLLECKNCRLGSDVYLLVFNDKKTVFEVNETSTIKLGNKKIKLFGWDTSVSISLKNGKIKTTETR
jgi:hypothetical protein